MNRVTSENIWSILKDGENERVEFKERRIHQKAFNRLVSAFANTEGGSIIFGIGGSNLKIVGIKPSEIQPLIENCKIMKKTNDSNCSCVVYSVEIEGKSVVVVDVEKSKKPVYTEGVAYERKGDAVFPKIIGIRSKYLKDFIDEIKCRNRNPRDVKALELLDDVSTNPERILEPGTKLYRCRIIKDMKDVESTSKDPCFYGYNAKQSFVPEPKQTSDMRANYRNIPYLYCANNPYTSLVEVRPRLGANVSIATIRTKEKITLLDFTLNIMPQKISSSKVNLFSDLSMLFSKPITSDDDTIEYIPTQYIAEYAKNLGYDGIAFRSSLTPEIDRGNSSHTEPIDRYNIVVFNYEKCEVTSSNIVNVIRNYFEFKQVDEDTTVLEINSGMLDTD